MRLFVKKQEDQPQIAQIAQIYSLRSPRLCGNSFLKEIT